MTHTAIIHSSLPGISQNVRVFPIVIAIMMLLLMTTFIQLAYCEDEKKELSIGERFHYETSLTWRGVIGDLFRGKPKMPLVFYKG